MKKTSAPARLVVVRTPVINELLQEAWALSPELKEKISLTVHQAIMALVRERRRYQAFASDSFSSAPGWETEAVRGESVEHSEVSTTSVRGESVEHSEVSTTEEAMPRAGESEPHPDTLWNE